MCVVIAFGLYLGVNLIKAKMYSQLSVYEILCAFCYYFDINYRILKILNANIGMLKTIFILRLKIYQVLVFNILIRFCAKAGYTKIMKTSKH